MSLRAKKKEAADRIYWLMDDMSVIQWHDVKNDMDMI